MATNYFENLGFGANLRQGLGDLAQVGYMKQAQAAQQAAEQKKEEQAMLKFANDQQKQRAAQSAGAFYNALQSNNPQLALQIAKQSEQDINSLGDPSFTVANVEQMLQTPEGMNQLKQMAAGTVQMAAGPDKFAEYVQAQQKPVEQKTYDQPASIKELEYYQKLQQTNPEAAAKFARSRGYVDTAKEENRTEAQRNMAEYQRLQADNPELAKQFGQSVGLVSKEGKELSAQSQKRLSEFTDNAIANSNLEQKYTTLANDFEKADLGGGIQTTWSQWAREQTGNQDEITELRKEFFKIRGSEVVNNLPPGAASDADIAMALSGFPGDKASGKQISSFLRGLAKLKAKEKELNEFKANYVSEKGTERGMLQEWKAKQNAGGNVVDWGSLQ
jgi:hypothetical protein